MLALAHLLVLALPVTNGSPDTAHPAVVALASRDGTVGCTGTLIGPHTVLTAAHCLGGVNVLVFFGESVTGAGTFADVSGALVHPAFDSPTFANDLGLLTIRQAAPVAPLPFGSAIDGALVGMTVDVVGFGLTGAGMNDAGVRRAGTSLVSEVTAIELSVTPDPAQPCTYDSGGAAIYQGALIGVVSHGDDACVDHAVFARVDVAVAGFIQPYLDATAPGTVHTGDRCLYDGHCAEGPCLQASDEPALWFCSQACGVCPEGMECAGGACRWPLPTPGALGAACASSDDCVSSICFADACTRGCLVDECPDGFACEHVEGLTYYCVSAEAGGCCAVAAGRRGRADLGFPAALLLLAVAIVARLFSPNRRPPDRRRSS